MTAPVIDLQAQPGEIDPMSVKRTRERRAAIRFKQNADVGHEQHNADPLTRQGITSRVCEMYRQDIRDRSEQLEYSLQLIAKFRQYREGSNFPWPDASDVALPDMTTSSLATQDSIHNAVMSSRPVVNSQAVREADENKQDTIDHVIDYQLFVEQDGEGEIGRFIEEFVNTPCATLYVPWVTEERKIRDIRVTGEIPGTLTPKQFFAQWIAENFQGANTIVEDEEGWDWTIQTTDEPSAEISAKFYTQDDEVIIVLEWMATRFDGPKLRCIGFQDIFHPVRCENLQPPGPSNPTGAAHVIMRDYPTIDEIERLRKAGTYKISDDDMEKIRNSYQDTAQHNEHREQVESLAGVVENAQKNDKTHGTVTRLMCFDSYDVDGDGINEDVVWWVIDEAEVLVRAEYMTEVYPSSRARRPFSEASYLPVKGLRWGISLLELSEGLRDIKKMLFDMSINAGTLTTTPFFTYRASSQINPEVLRLYPGAGIPVSDPQRDIHFPKLSNDSQAWALNMITMVDQRDERLTAVTDLSLGRVPAGKSSALRTVGGINAILGQGEARPERILRRFFTALTDACSWIHELNTHYLPEYKQFRMYGVEQRDKNPYSVVQRREDLKGQFSFGFAATILNTTKAAKIEGMERMIDMFMSDVAIQLGISDAETLYNLFTDLGNALGGRPERYLKPPRKSANMPRITWEEALTSIWIHGYPPDGVPFEGPEQHIAEMKAGLQEARMDGESILQRLNPTQRTEVDAWITKVQELADQEAALAKQSEAAGSIGQPIGGNAGAAPQSAQAPNMANQQLQENELLDESLPSAGGGGQPQ